MEKDSILLFIITDGLNQKQSEFIDSFVKSYDFQPEYVTFETNDLNSEVNSFRITKERAEEFQKGTGKKPFFLFAVEHGTYFITRTVEDFGIENLIHIDVEGVRFGY